jgi:hypothetical protein
VQSTRVQNLGASGKSWPIRRDYVKSAPSTFWLRTGGLGIVAEDQTQLVLQLSLDAVATRHVVQQLEQPECVGTEAVIAHGDQGAGVGVRRGAPCGPRLGH